MTQRPARRILCWILKVALAVILGALLFEGAIRFLLYSDMASSWDLARRLRNPGRFADYVEDEYWVIQHRLQDPDSDKGPNGYDEKLGWVGSTIVPGTYRHVGDPPPPDLQPILLYGDSFSQCTVPEEDCFQGLVASSNLSSRFALVNFGVGGFGLDQIYLLLQRSIDSYAARNPFVLVGLLVDGDLDRCLLQLYGCSKPRLLLEEGRLVPLRERVPTCREFLDQHSFKLPSLAARLLIFDTDILPREWRRTVSGRRDKAKLKAALTRKLLEELHAELEQRNLRHVFVLFYTESFVRGGERDLEEDKYVKAALDNVGAHWLDMGAALRADTQRTGRPLTEYYDQIQPPMGHPTRLGNQVMLDAMIAGLEQYCGLDRRGLALSAANFTKVELRGRGAVARYNDAARSPLPDGTEIRRVILRVGAEGPTEIHYDLNSDTRAFRCGVRATPFKGEKTTALAAMRLRALADGVEIFSRTIAQGEAQQFDLALDLGGKRNLALILDDNGDGWENDALVLCDPVFE